MEARRSLIDRVVRIVAVAAVFSLVVGYAIFLFPSTKTDQTSGTDFSEFYCAGLMVRQGLGHRLYDLAEQARCQSAVASVRAFYLRPPFESLLFIPLSYLNYRHAYLLWTLASVLMLVISAHFIESLTTASRAITRHTHIWADFGLLLALFVTFSPFATSLVLGQDAALVLLIYTLVFVLLVRRQEVAAGLVLGCALFKFQMVLPLTLILLLRRKWGALVGLSASGAVLVLISVAISGRQVLLQYPRLLLTPGPYRKLLGWTPLCMPNVRGLLTLLLGNFSSTATITFLTIMVSFLLVCLAARFWNDDQPKLSFGAALLASLLTSYHLYHYDLTLLLLAIPIVFGEQLSRAAKWSAVPFFIPPLHVFLLERGIYSLMFVPMAGLLVGAISVLRSRRISARRCAAFGGEPAAKR